VTISSTPRFGLTQWSADTDAPSRAQFETSFANIDTLAAIDLQGAIASRPAPGTVGRYFYATDTGYLYRDNGTSWTTININLGLGGANPTTSTPGDSAGAGSSTSAAPVDHRHAREPWGTTATTSTPGDSESGGTAAYVARADHAHGREPYNGSVSNSHIGDTGTPGSTNTLARGDHVHGREAFAGSSGHWGSSTSPARSDHDHSAGGAAWAAIALTTGSDYGAPYGSVASRVMPDGTIRLRGVITIPSGTSGTANLTGTNAVPSPSTQQSLGNVLGVSGSSDAAGVLTITTSGQLALAVTGSFASTAYLYLDGLTYPLT
jgi:hypothetical protein